MQCFDGYGIGQAAISWVCYIRLADSTPTCTGRNPGKPGYVLVWVGVSGVILNMRVMSKAEAAFLKMYRLYSEKLKIVLLLWLLMLLLSH